MTKWISKDMRLPEVEKIVLVVEDGLVFIGKYKPDYAPQWPWVVARDNGRMLGSADVTHWMPLPQPPKAKP